MNDKTHPRGGATTFDVSVLAGRSSALKAAKRYTSTSVAAEFAALQAAMRPAEAFRKQLEALDPTLGIRAALEKYKLPDVHLNAMRAANLSALTQIRGHSETCSAAARFAALYSRAIEEVLSPSKMAARYLDDLIGSRTLKSAAEQALKWSDPHKELSGALERFRDSLDISSARALLESMAKASEAFEIGRLLEDAAQFGESDAACEDVAHLVLDVTEGISKASTVQEAVDQIVQAIQATKEPLHQRLVFACLVPILIAIVFAFINPVGDFYVKRWLDGTPKQETTKQVKEAAREAVGDVRVLNEFRFVSTQILAMINGPKARAPVVGQLRFGQTVRVLERKQDFTLVVWRSEDGKVELQGWVFSRYLKRFD
ncbi:hypothetical protein CLD22_12165 [Rubrivivax gelatinosus]|nr:hypothetical protein [Rubrivivax gelatinosus]